MSNLKRREEEVEADNDVEYDQVLVLVEVSAPITKSALGDVTIRSIVQLHISCDRNIPENVKVTPNQKNPMHEILKFLLICDLSPGVIEAVTSSIVQSIHGLQKVLGTCSLDININGFNSLQLHGHRFCAQPLQPLFLLAEEALGVCIIN